MTKLLTEVAHRSIDAVTEPVSLEEAKAAVGVAACTTGHNSRLRTLIKAARQKVEKDTRRAFIQQTWVTKLEDWPDTNNYIELPRPPLISVSSVVYQSSTAGTTTWSSGDYILDTVSEPGAIYVRDSVTWPSYTAWPSWPITITSLHGYSTDSDGVPADAKIAILSLIDDWFCAAGIDGPMNTRKYDGLVSTLRWGDYQ